MLFPKPETEAVKAFSQILEALAGLPTLDIPERSDAAGIHTSPEMDTNTTKQTAAVTPTLTVGATVRDTPKIASSTE